MFRFYPKSIPYLSVVLLLVFTTAGLDATPPPACPDIALAGGTSIAESALPDSELTVVSLNMAKEIKPEKILRDLRSSPMFGSADVWLLQEAVRREKPSNDVVSDVAAALRLHYVSAPADALDDGLFSGLAILSRYPIEDAELIRLPRYDLRFRTRCRIALAATVKRDSGPVRVFNVHLDTRITQQQRMGQIEPILQMAKTSPAPAIVGGDFNSANIRWVGNVLPIPYAQNHARALRSLFTSSGFESPLDGKSGTFHLLWMQLNLDWIFQKGLRTVASGVEDVPFSDHEAVWVSLQ